MVAGSAVWEYIQHSILPYRTSKHLVVDQWQVGLGFRLLQLGVLIFAVVEAFADGTWAYSERPVGSVNAYASSSNAFLAANNGSIPLSNWVYCPEYNGNPPGNAEYSYNYGVDFDYTNPICVRSDQRDVTQKGPSSLFVTTVYIEEQFLGWNCAWSTGSTEQKAAVNAKLAICNLTSANDAAVEDLGNGQCQCRTAGTEYPVQPEDLYVQFEHAYDTTDKVGDLTASSNELNPESAAPLVTKFTFANGQVKIFPAGTSPKIKIQDLLLKSNLAPGWTSLNQFTDFSERSNPPSPNQFPAYRTTGVMLQMNIKYSNKDTDGQVQPFSKDVYAEVEVVPIKGVWAGWGAITFFPEYPNGGSYHKVHRYRQGVLMEFSARGLVYRFDWFFFLNLVIATLVLLRVCGAVVDFIIFYCIPYRGFSHLLYTKRNERVDQKTVFASLGLSAAISVQQFNAFDVGKNGYLTFSELVRMFGGVEDVTYEHAEAIAHSVLHVAGKELEDSNERVLMFTDFVHLIEGHDTMNFGKYLNTIQKVARSGSARDRGPTEGQRMEAQKAYEEAEVAAGFISEADANGVRNRRTSATSASGRAAQESSDGDSRPAAGSVPADAVQVAVQPPPMPVQPVAPPAQGNAGKITCYSCHNQFYAPAGASVVACPYCKTHNRLQMAVVPAEVR